MLGGLDARGTAADYEPSIINVADRTDSSGRVTVYVDEVPSLATRRRLRYVGERLAFFADAGVVRAPTVVRWPKTTLPSSPATEPVKESQMEKLETAIEEAQG
jgi:hypothetical protein